MFICSRFTRSCVHFSRDSRDIFDDDDEEEEHKKRVCFETFKLVDDKKRRAWTYRTFLGKRFCDDDSGRKGGRVNKLRGEWMQCKGKLLFKTWWKWMDLFGSFREKQSKSSKTNLAQNSRSLLLKSLVTQRDSIYPLGETYPITWLFYIIISRRLVQVDVEEDKARHF